MKLIATKPLRYGTRRLLAGDPFDASPRDARVLFAIKKARDPNKRQPVRLAPPPPDIAVRLAAAAPVPEEPEPQPKFALSAPEPAAAAVADDESVESVECGPDIDALRSEAQALGLAVDRRWGERRIREAMEAARHDAPE